mmetsp:Transcript_22952/g.48788  ORF Transcript_22952/g.48788 Transcript_22952/m.48788 type:complete len:90 (-) Transcript_22952:184-453(-)
MASTGVAQRLRLVIALLLVCCTCTAPGQSIGIGQFPACWINWNTTVELEGGQELEGEACMLIPWVTILNTAFFYVLFWFLIKALILSTQ